LLANELGQILALYKPPQNIFFHHRGAEGTEAGLARSSTVLLFYCSFLTFNLEPLTFNPSSTLLYAREPEMLAEIRNFHSYIVKHLSSRNIPEKLRFSLNMFREQAGLQV